MADLEDKVIDLNSELLLSKRERQRLGEKLDCLILLVRRAWQGDIKATSQVSHIVGVPVPTIIPHSNEETKENEKIGQEYLSLTSSMLDQQLAEDSNIKKKTKVLRPTSGVKRSPGYRRVRSASYISADYKPQPIAAFMPERENQTNKNVETYPKEVIPPDPELNLGSVNLTMADLTGMVPLFTCNGLDRAAINRAAKERLELEEKRSSEMKKFDDNSHSPSLFHPRGIVRPKNARPVSAALQKRHDYTRAQTQRRLARPHTAIGNKPAFRHITDSEYDMLLKTSKDQLSPEMKSPGPRNSVSSPHRPDSEGASISVNILQRNQGNKRTNVYSTYDRDTHALGDVVDALQRVQDMERIFRENTRRLQQKIGIPIEGII